MDKFMEEEKKCLQVPVTSSESGRNEPKIEPTPFLFHNLQ